MWVSNRLVARAYRPLLLPYPFELDAEQGIFSERCLLVLDISRLSVHFDDLQHLRFAVPRQETEGC